MNTIFKIKRFQLLGFSLLLFLTCDLTCKKEKECSPSYKYKIGYYPPNTCGFLASEGGCSIVHLKNMSYFSSGKLKGFDYEACGETGSVMITYDNLGCVEKVEQHCSN
jgi:hypothetical protein